MSEMHEQGRVDRAIPFPDGPASPFPGGMEASPFPGGVGSPFPGGVDEIWSPGIPSPFPGGGH